MGAGLPVPKITDLMVIDIRQWTNKAISISLNGIVYSSAVHIGSD
ncbi:rod shape-determining protein [Candidatus Erwinia haradaeae]|nr:rod shape-determining protein [Candidatus Erwinia haradaeae]